MDIFNLIAQFLMVIAVLWFIDRILLWLLGGRWRIIEK
jgi:hypothetical protein